MVNEVLMFGGLVRRVLGRALVYRPAWFAVPQQDPLPPTLIGANLNRGMPTLSVPVIANRLRRGNPGAARTTFRPCGLWIAAALRASQ